MDLHELKLFLHLAGSLHFGKTARACHISPSALSRTIRRLEEEVGHSLFDRDNRSVQLSTVGLRFRDFARETVGSWNQLIDSLRAGEQDLSGEITLFSSVTAAYSVLTDLFARFRSKYPKIHIKLQTGDAAHAIEYVQDGTADITVAAKPDRLAPGLLFRAITATPLVFISPVVECDVKALTDRLPIAWHTVPMILAEQALSRKRVDVWFKGRGIRPNIYAEVAGHEAILSMVRLGCGVGVVPQLVLENSSLKNEVRILPVTPELEPYEVGLCAHRRRISSPVVLAFWDIVTK